MRRDWRAHQQTRWLLRSHKPQTRSTASDDGSVSSAAGKSSADGSGSSASCHREEQISYSAMTGQSLFYMGGMDLKNKILAISEEEGIRQAAYALKLLQSRRQTNDRIYRQKSWHRSHGNAGIPCRRPRHDLLDHNGYRCRSGAYESLHGSNGQRGSANKPQPFCNSNARKKRSKGCSRIIESRQRAISPQRAAITKAVGRGQSIRRRARLPR